MKKLLCVLFGLAVLGMTSVFSAEGKKIEDLKTLFPDSSVSYTFNMNNKSTNDVSIFLIKFVVNTKTEVYEYVIPAKTKDVIEFSAQIDNLAGSDLFLSFFFLDIFLATFLLKSIFVTPQSLNSPISMYV